MNQVANAYEFTQFETHVITKLEEQDNEEFGVFVINTIIDKEGKENRKMLEIAMGNSRWQTEFQIDCTSPVSFILQAKLHELKIKDRFLGVRKVSDGIKNIFYSATDDVIRIIGRTLIDVESEGWMAKQAEL